MKTLLEIRSEFPTIASLLKAEPWRWIQRRMFASINLGSVSRDNATCGCLGGLLGIYYGPEGSEFSDKFHRTVRACRVRIGDLQTDGPIPAWNDANGRTVEDVIKLCKEVGI